MREELVGPDLEKSMPLEWLGLVGLHADALNRRCPELEGLGGVKRNPTLSTGRMGDKKSRGVGFGDACMAVRGGVNETCAERSCAGLWAPSPGALPPHPHSR